MQARLSLRYPPHFYTLWFRPEGRGTFLCSAKEKYPKETRPDGLPATRVPCASRYFERSPNSQNLLRLRLANPARQYGSLALKIPAMLGCANGVWVDNPGPVALTEYRSQSGKRCAPCSRQVLWGRLAGPVKLRVARAPDWRGTQGIGVSR